MDKEAQGEIARELARQDDELIWKHLKPEIQALLLIEAGQILQILGEFGYRKLPEGQPPLLSDGEITKISFSTVMGRYKEVAQAQLEADIKFYTGKP